MRFALSESTGGYRFGPDEAGAVEALVTRGTLPADADRDEDWVDELDGLAGVVAGGGGGAVTVAGAEGDSSWSKLTNRSLISVGGGVRPSGSGWLVGTSGERVAVRKR